MVTLGIILFVIMLVSFLVTYTHGATKRANDHYVCNADRLARRKSIRGY